ncbi:hypothetical protein Tco_0266647 [Tanacetum coccineum]
MTAVKERKKRALADLRYRALKGKPLKKSEVTQLMRNLVKNQCQLVFLGCYNHYCDDPDSAGGGSSISADSAASSSPSNVSTDHIPIDVLFASTSGGINDFFLDSDEEEQIGRSRVAADPDSDDEVLAEIIFRGKSISGDGVVLVDKLPDDEIVASRLSSESESDDDMENYIPPLPYGEFKDWEMVSCPPGNSYIHVYHQQNRRRKYFTYLKQLLPHVYREDILLRLTFWRPQDEWIIVAAVVSQELSVHVLDLTNGKTVYMFVDKFYPIRATLLERMLRHRLTVPPSYCRDVVVAGNIIQTGLRQSYECLASAPIACTARQMVFSSPWLTPKKESGSPLQTALVCNSNPLIALASPEQTATGKDVSNPLYGCDGLPKTVRKLLFFDVAASFDSAVHRVHAVSFDAAVASTVSVACWFYDAAAHFVSAAPQSSCFEKIYLETWN